MYVYAMYVYAMCSPAPHAMQRERDYVCLCYMCSPAPHAMQRERLYMSMLCAPRLPMPCKERDYVCLCYVLPGSPCHAKRETMYVYAMCSPAPHAMQRERLCMSMLCAPRLPMPCKERGYVCLCYVLPGSPCHAKRETMYVYAMCSPAPHAMQRERPCMSMLCAPRLPMPCKERDYVCLCYVLPGSPCHAKRETMYVYAMCSAMQRERLCMSMLCAPRLPMPCNERDYVRLCYVLPGSPCHAKRETMYVYAMCSPAPHAMQRERLCMSMLCAPRLPMPCKERDYVCLCYALPGSPCHAKRETMYVYAMCSPAPHALQRERLCMSMLCAPRLPMPCKERDYVCLCYVLPGSPCHAERETMYVYAMCSPAPHATQRGETMYVYAMCSPAPHATQRGETMYVYAMCSPAPHAMQRERLCMSMLCAPRLPMPCKERDYVCLCYVLPGSPCHAKRETMYVYAMCSPAPHAMQRERDYVCLCYMCSPAPHAMQRERLCMSMLCAPRLPMPCKERDYVCLCYVLPGSPCHAKRETMYVYAMCSPAPHAMQRERLCMSMLCAPRLPMPCKERDYVCS